MGRRGKVVESGPRLRESAPVPPSSIDPHAPCEGLVGPVRTCVGCRGRDHQDSLVRFVADRSSQGDGSQVVLTADPGRSLPGRGAWLHPRAGCAELAVRRKAFPRALRAAVVVDPEQMKEALGSVPRVSTTRRQGSGFEADGRPMSTQR